MKSPVLIVFVILVFSGISRAQPSDGELFSESLRLYENKRYDESSQLLKNLLHRDSKKAIYWFNLGNNQYMMKSYGLALKCYDKVIALNAAFVPAARLYRVKTLKMMGLHEQAAAELTQLRQSRLPPGLDRASLNEQQNLDSIADAEDEALQKYQAGDYAKVEILLRQFDQESLSLDGRTLLGMALLKQKKLLESEEVFNRLSKNSSLDEDQKVTVLELLHRSRRGESEKYPYWLALDVSYGTTDNAFYDGNSITPTQSSLQRAFVGFGYHFNSEKPLSEKLSYALNYESPDKAPEMKTLTQTVQASFLYQRTRLDASLSPYFQAQTWNNISASQKVGVGGRAYYSFESVEFGTDLDAYSQQASNSSYSYLTGSGASFRPSVGFWGNHFYAQLYWMLGLDGSQDITYSDGSKLPMNQTYQGPGGKGIWKMSESLLLSVGMSAFQHDFKNPALPSQKKRKDSDLSSYFKLSYYVWPQFAVYGLAESTTNSSTLGSQDVRDKNYAVKVFTMGLSWDVF